LTGVENKNNAGVVVADFDYTRRVDGQITQVVEAVRQPDNSIATTTANYGYDALNRLTSEQVETSTVGSDYTVAYTLDLVGNRFAKQTTRENGTIERVDSIYNNRDQ
jgi:hypothetical protein